MLKIARRVTSFLAAFLATSPLAACSIAAADSPSGGPVKSLDVRALNIVDARGQTRIRLAAPLPDPPGAKRKVTATGIQFLDEAGREVGGLAMLSPIGVRGLGFDTDD